MRVLANDGMDKNAMEILKKDGILVDSNHYEKEELYNIIKDFDILIVRSATKADREFIDAAKKARLKLIIRAGVGLDNIDIPYAVKNGIEVRNTPNSSSNSVAELVLGHMIGLARYITIANITLREGKWNKKAYTGTELSGKTFGIIGFGRIGKALANKASALGMNVIYYDKYYKNDDKYKYVDFEELLKNADFISLHVPGVDKAIIGEAEIKLMKDGVFLINAARGGVIDENALLEALNTDKVAGAGIDVFIQEPKPNQDLCNHPKVSVTPHIGAATQEAQMRIGGEIVDIIMDFYNNTNEIAI
ncbi:MAG: D-2-hydroxyacid dehydrogenase [Gudongella sp.]|jgi:D-3-phosphoglycerate dehydrogenase|nr:D-2-hydroxyacid dehydrogenase [Gudongella sp.]